MPKPEIERLVRVETRLNSIEKKQDQSDENNREDHKDLGTKVDGIKDTINKFITKSNKIYATKDELNLAKKELKDYKKSTMDTIKSAIPWVLTIVSIFLMYNA